jgi:hypothetical protein
VVEEIDAGEVQGRHERLARLHDAASRARRPEAPAEVLEPRSILLAGTVAGMGCGREGLPTEVAVRRPDGEA